MPTYQHLIGCMHSAILNDSSIDSYEESYNCSNSETVNQNDNLNVVVGAPRSDSCLNIDKSMSDQYEDKRNGKEKLEDDEKIQI